MAGWGGSRPGAGKKKQNPANRPRLEAKPRLVRPEPKVTSPQPVEVAKVIDAGPAIDPRAWIEMLPQIEEISKRYARNQARTSQNSPFRLPKFPKAALPPESVTMAMDSALCDNLSFANQDWLAGEVINGVTGEGLLFLGYSYLSELAQRPEYRVMAETIADDATRKWIDFDVVGDAKTEREKRAKDPEGYDERMADPDERQKRLKAEGKLDKVKAMRDDQLRLCVKDRMYEQCRNDGFFGRSHLFLDIHTNGPTSEDELKMPIGDGRDSISKSKVPKGSFKDLRTIEPVWTYPLNYNANDPLAESWYNPQVWYVMGKEIHGSRLQTFIGHPVPDMLKPAYAFGGLSLTQMAKPYVDIWLQTRQSVADLIHSFSVMVLMTDLSTLMQPGNVGALLARAAMFNMLRDNNGLFVANKNTEDFKNVSASLSGLHELQSQAQEHMASVHRIPLVKFTGIQPAGLNASSEGEIKVYDDTIMAYQSRFIAPNLTKIINFEQLSLFGEIDPAITYKFMPLREMTQAEKGQKEKDDADRNQKYVDMGALHPGEVRAVIINDPDLPYTELDPDDVPDLLSEEQQGLEPVGGRPQERQDDGEEPTGAEDAGWNEGDHPRAPDGQFGSGGRSKKKTKKKAVETEGKAGGGGGESGGGEHDTEDPSLVAVPMSKNDPEFSKAVADWSIKRGYKPEVKRLPIEKLRATQKELNAPDEDTSEKGAVFKQYSDKPLVVRENGTGTLHIVDGHNRISAAVRAGRPIDGYVFEEADVDPGALKSLRQKYTHGGGANDAADPFGATDAVWSESDHPRAPDGKFGKGGGTAYHGSESKFDKFDPARMGEHDSGFLGKGFYFSTDPQIGRTNKHTMEVKLDVKNPLEVELKDFRTDKKKVVREALGLSDSATSDQVTKALIEKGYDAVVLDMGPTGYKHQEIMIPDTGQIEYQRHIGEMTQDEARFEESKHPRDEDGKFASGAGASGGAGGSGGFKPAPQNTFKTKKEQIGHLLTKGTTPKEVMKELGWPSVSMPQQAASLYMKLEKYKEDGVTKYRGVPMTDAEKDEAKAAEAAKRAAKSGNKSGLRGRAAADPKTWSLFEFLASSGGLKPTADLHHIFGSRRGPFVPGFGPLLRPGGLPMDEALTRAKENAYVLDPNDIQHIPGMAAGGENAKRESTVRWQDLQDMIAEEASGKKQYRTDYTAPEAKVDSEEEARHIVDALHREVQATGGTVDPALEDRVVQIIQKEGESDVLAAYERAIMEDHDNYEAARDDRQAAGYESEDWDVFPDSASGYSEAPFDERW